MFKQVAALIPLLLISFNSLSFNPDSLYFEGERQFEERKYILSIEAFKEAVRGFQDVGDVEKQAKSVAYIGSNYLRLGMRDEANDKFQTSVRLFDSINSNDCFHYGRALSMSGMYDRSNSVFRKCLDNIKTLDWMGRNYRLQGNLDSALYYHNRALALDPKKNWAHQSIGKIYFSMGKYDRAMASFNKSLELAGADSVLAYYIKTNISEVYMAKGDYENAIKSLLYIKVPPMGGNAGVINNNNKLLAEAYSMVRLQNIEKDVDAINSKLIWGLLLILALSVFVGMFYYNQRLVNKEKVAVCIKDYAALIELCLIRVRIAVLHGDTQKALKSTNTAKRIAHRIRDIKN